MLSSSLVHERCSKKMGPDAIPNRLSALNKDVAPTIIIKGTCYIHPCGANMLQENVACGETYSQKKLAFALLVRYSVQITMHAPFCNGLHVIQERVSANAVHDIIR